MKTTLDLPDPLMRRVKIRAASEGRKLKEVIAELLEKGMDGPSAETLLPEGELPYAIDPGTGMAVSRVLKTPGFVPPTAEESQAIIERANEEEDLRRAGLLSFATMDADFRRFEAAGLDLILIPRAHSA